MNNVVIGLCAFLLSLSTGYADETLDCRLHFEGDRAGCSQGYYCPDYKFSDPLACLYECKKMESSCVVPAASGRLACPSGKIYKCFECGKYGQTIQCVKDDRPKACFSVDSTVLILDDVVQESRMDALDEFLTIQVYDGEKVDFQQAFVKIINAKENSKINLMELTTTSGRFVKATPTHLFHFGDSCCSYKSMKQISDFQEGDAIWVLGDDDQPTQDVVASLSKPFGVSRVADVIPFDRVRPSAKSDGSCTWEATNFIVVNGFISTHHALEEFESDANAETVSRIPVEDRLLAIDILADELLLGLKDLSVSSRLVSEDTENVFLDFMEDLKGLVQYCTSLHECDLEFLNHWFADRTINSEVSKWLDWKILIEEATTYDLVFGSADRAKFFHKLILQIRAAKKGTLCHNLDLSQRATFLYSLFGTFASMWL